MPYDPYDEEDYYTLSNPALAGDRFAPYSEGAVAFDQPSEQGVRYPIATPNTGGQVGSFGAVTPDFQRALDEMAARDRPRSDELYGAQIARAERNRIEDAGSDPAAIQQAIRLQGLFEYRGDLARGVPAVEAMRRAAPKLYYNHPLATVSAFKSSETEPQEITEIPMTGGNAILAGGKYRAFNRIPNGKDLGAELDKKEAGEDVLAAMREYNTAKKGLYGGLMPPDAKLVQEKKDALDVARTKRRDLVRKPGSELPSAKLDTSSIPKWKIDKLKSNPNLAPDFDAIYGSGAAKTILGK